MTQILRKLALVVLSPLLMLGLLEITVEMFANVPDGTSPIVLWGEVSDADLYTKGSVFRSNLSWFWEPRPGERFYGGVVNAEGYRGAVIAKAKGSAFRIVTLGDSSTMGLGVSEAQAWPRVLERILRAEGRDVEVVNLGVVGFTAFQGYQYYMGKARDYFPNLVLLAFGACNEQFRDVDGYTDREKARILASSAYRLREFSDRFALMRWIGTFSAPSPIATLGPPKEKSPRVSPQELEELYSSICQEQRRAGGGVAFISPPRQVQGEIHLPETKLYTPAVEHVARALDVPLADVYTAFRASEKAGESRLFLDPFHPTPEGHERYAEIVARTLDTSGVLPARKR